MVDISDKGKLASNEELGALQVSSPGKSLKEFGMYVIKAVVVLALLFVISWFAPSLSRVGVGITWAFLTIVSSVGIAYCAVVKKTHKQFMLKREGALSKLNEGRVFRLIISFIVSAVLMAGLILSLPRWGWPEWLLVVVAVPGYYLVSLLMAKLLSRQYEPLFQQERIVWWSSIATGLLLCVGYLVLVAVQPVVLPTSAEAALEAAVNPFEGSGSVLLSEGGRYGAYGEALVSFSQEQVSHYSFGLYAAWRILVSASALFGIASLLGVCALKLSEIKRIFTPLESVKHSFDGQSPIRRYIVVACVLPLCLVVGFVVADVRVQSLVESQEYGELQEVVQEQAKIFAWALDGKLYEEKAVQELIDETKLKSKELWGQAADTVVPLINALVDKQLENVDPYLDWYYSLPADYERLAQIFTGTIEEGMKDQLEAQINNGVDDSELMSQLEGYMSQADELEAWYQEQLADCELIGVSEQDVVVTRELPTSFVTEPLAPSQKLLNAGSRMGVSAGAGVVAGFATTAAVKNIVAKPFFSKIVAKVTEILASRGLLAGAGTLVAPGVGTVIGIGLGFAADFAILKIDEAMNRESYRAEIVDALEAQRSEWLALFEDDSPQEA